jgi:hypothetical protein
VNLTDAAILALERQTFRRPGAKAQAIRDAFDLSETRYYQRVVTILDDPAALRVDPLTVRRLQRIRDDRRRRRAG